MVLCLLAFMFVAGCWVWASWDVLFPEGVDEQTYRRGDRG